MLADKKNICAYGERMDEWSGCVLRLNQCRRVTQKIDLNHSRWIGEVSS